MINKDYNGKKKRRTVTDLKLRPEKSLRCGKCFFDGVDGPCSFCGGSHE